MASCTWLLCGIPRSGSSLCCRLVGAARDTVALSEPLAADVFDDTENPDVACARIRDFVRETRAGILADGRARSMQLDGRLDDRRVSDETSAAGLRPPRGGLGEIALDKPLSPNFSLLVKHNGMFAMLLPELADHFQVLALVRNPVAVLASWQTVDLAVQQGRVPVAERFDARLRRTLDAEPDTLRRQVIVLDWFFSRFTEHLPPAGIVRYEDIVASRGLSLFRRLRTASPPLESLESRNANALYAGVDVDALLQALDAANGAWSACYGRRECEQAAAAIRAGR